MEKIRKILPKLLPPLLLAVVALALTLPFLGGTLYHGSDLGYHLRRIENIAIALTQGQFPVRIQPDWLSGYGYATGVFYGDVLLYFPAALRILGVPVTVAYGLYVGGVNLGTALAAYWCGRRLAASRSAALTASLLYTLCAYRLCDLTTRAALGEYTALAFLPLVACGFWQTLCPPAQKQRLPGWALLLLGLSGVLQSHLLSFEMTVLCLVAAALLLGRYTFRKAALARIGGAAGVFCLLNAGYLLPLFDYYFTQKFQINQPGGTEPIGQNGAILGQLLALPYTVASDEQTDLVQNMALTPGAALLLGALAALAVAVWVLLAHRGKPAGALAVLGLLGAGALTLWLSSNFFPWDALYGLGGAAQSLVGSLQFPWRFLGVAALFLALAVGGGLTLLPKPTLRIALVAALCLLSVSDAAGQLQAFTATAQAVNYTYGTEESNWERTCGHYLPAEQGQTQLNDLPTGPVWGDGIELTEYSKTGTTITVTLQNSADVAAELRLPLLWYKGYEVNSDAATLICGKNNSVTLQIAPGYSGTLTVRFAEPWYWRAAELLSTFTVLALLLLPLRRLPAKR